MRKIPWIQIFAFAALVALIVFTGSTIVDWLAVDVIPWIKENLFATF